MRDSMVFYKSFAEALEILPPEQYKETVQAILKYAMDDIEPELDGFSMALFVMAKPTIDSNNKKYEKGKTGGRPSKKNNKTDGLENEKPMVSDINNHRNKKTKSTVDDTVTVSATDSVNEPVNVTAPVNNYSPVFEEIWKAYPRKKEKAAAFKAYKARLHDFPEEQLLLAVKRYAEECRILETEERYIKHGATFFGPSMPFADYLAEDWKPPEDSRKQRNGFHNFEQRDYDFDALQKAWGG